MREDVCIDGHEQSNVIEDCTRFLKKIIELKPYIVKFNQDKIIKPKLYLFDYVVGRENHWLVVVITQNKCIFFVNNRVQRA